MTSGHERMNCRARCYYTIIRVSTSLDGACTWDATYETCDFIYYAVVVVRDDADLDEQSYLTMKLQCMFLPSS